MKTESNFNEIAFHEQAIRKLFKKPVADEESFYTTVTLSAQEVCKIIEKYVNMFKTKSEVESVQLDVTFDAFSGALVTLVPKKAILAEKLNIEEASSESTMLTFAGNLESPQALELPEKQNFKETLKENLKYFEDREMYEECGKIHQAIETLTKSESKK